MSIEEINELVAEGVAEEFARETEEALRAQAEYEKTSFPARDWHFLAPITRSF